MKIVFYTRLLKAWKQLRVVKGSQNKVLGKCLLPFVCKVDALGTPRQLRRSSPRPACNRDQGYKQANTCIQNNALGYTDNSLSPRDLTQ